MAPQRQWFGHSKLDLHLEMIVQVLAHTGQVHRHLYGVLAQVVGGSNAAEHHQMRRSDGAGRKHHGFGMDQIDITALSKFNARDLCALHLQSQNLLIGLDGQVFTIGDRMQKRVCRAPTAPVFDVKLERTKPLLRCAIIIRVIGISHLYPGLDKGLIG